MVECSSEVDRREWDSCPTIHNCCLCPLACHAGAGDASHSVTPPGGSLCYCTCAQEAISTKRAGRKWLVSGLKDHRYLSVTKNATRRQPAGGTPTSVQGLCSGMHQMLSLCTDPWICHISSRVQVCNDSNGNAETPSPRAGGPTGTPTTST